MIPQAVLAELDRRLAPGRRRPDGGLPGRAVHPPAGAHLLRAGRRRRPRAGRPSWGEPALAALDEHGLPDLGLDPDAGRAGAAPGAGEAGPRAGRGPAGGQRGRLPRAARPRGRRRGARPRRCWPPSRPLPPFWGTRAKSLEGPTRHRGVRSLDLFLGGLAGRGRAVVTLPKVTAVEQVAAFLPVLDALEQAHGLGLDLELQVETPQAVLGADGAATLAAMLHAGGGRVTGLHYGTYDYSASLGIAAAHQASDHPAADHAKADHAGGGRRHRGPGGRRLDQRAARSASPRAVHAAWQLHAGLVRRALERGFYQGWDLHPAQLVTRYAATYAFFRAALPAAGARLAAYVGPGRGRGARRAGDRPGAGHRGAARAGLRGARRRRGGRCDRSRAHRAGPAGRPATRHAGTPAGG